jgi:hypothetical protein
LSIGKGERNEAAVCCLQLTGGSKGECNTGGRTSDRCDDERSSFSDDNDVFTVQGSGQLEGRDGSSRIVWTDSGSDGGCSGDSACRIRGISDGGGCNGDVDGDIIDNNDSRRRNVGGDWNKDDSGTDSPVFLVTSEDVTAVVFGVDLDDLVVGIVPILVRTDVFDNTWLIVVDGGGLSDGAAAFGVVSWCWTVGGSRIGGSGGGRDELSPGSDNAGRACGTRSDCS